MQLETEALRTEMSASGDVVVEREPSMDPHDTHPVDNTVFIPNSEVHFIKPERVSPAPSCLSMRSDTSMGQPINFSAIHRMKQDRGVSPAVSMKSDWSMDHPYNFKRELTTPDSGVGVSPAPSGLSLRSDRSMGLPFNFRESVIEFSSILLSSACVRCSLCSSILTNPVSIHCGHSYCQHCINTYWSQLGPTGDYACPQCKINYPTRPVLSVNLALDWTLQALQETSFSPACPTLPQAGPGDVACDICSSLKLRAVKTCVTCSASYCESHVRQHYTDPALQKHTLVQVNEDTKLSQWGRNSVKMEDIKKEPFESEDHQEVENKRMKMEVEKEDEMFQHGSLEHSDLKNVSTHLQPLQEKGGNPMGVNGGGGVSPQSQQASLLQDTRMHVNVNSQGLMNDGVGSMPTADPPSTPGTRKSWQRHITVDMRNYLVDWFVQAVFPTTDHATLKDRRMESLVACAREVEGDVYESANSRAEYNYLIEEEICKLQKELQESTRLLTQSLGPDPWEIAVIQDGPLPDPPMVRPPGPNPMVNRMQGPGKQKLQSKANSRKSKSPNLGQE